MNPPEPTPILRFIHIDNLSVCLRRGGLHAPNHTPSDGLVYRTIHNAEIQAKRRQTVIRCGLGGTVHDFVPFYFGFLSPMMLQLHTGRVPGYAEGQLPLIYLVSTAQAVRESGAEYVFSDGHGIAAYTSWFDSLTELNKVDWEVVRQRYWRDTDDDLDRQRRKQAEFLVHRFCDWSLIDEIVVIDDEMRGRVESIFGEHPPALRKLVSIRRGWYYN